MSATAVQQLFRRCATGRDNAGWEEFVYRFEPRLRDGVRRALGRSGVRATPDLVDEMVQEVYCHLLEQNGRRLLGFRGVSYGEVLVYLGKTAQHVVLDRLRNAGAAKRGGDLLVPCESSLAGRLMDPEPDPETRLLLQEARWLFLQRCRQVSGGPTAGRNLRILHLALFDGWTSREIADLAVAGLKSSSIDSLIHRLRKRLAETGLALPRRN
jgi:DNA-directed RNA polymerase specialized sigma24 family protein